MKDYKKLYEESLKRAKYVLTTDMDNSGHWAVNYIFPELKELTDEEIRQEMIQFFVRLCGDKGDTTPDKKYEKYIAWLEKQGDSDETKAKIFLISKGYPIDANGIFPTYEEMYNIIIEGLEHKGYSFKKPIDKVEPKFKDGDIIKHNKANIICKVISVNSGSYYVENIETSGRIELFNAEQNFHLWTIEDTQPGDVIVLKNEDIYWIILFKSIKSFEGKDISYYVLKSADDTELIINETCYAYDLNDLYPATTKQQQILFKAIENAGYEWDDESLSLIKIKDEKNNGSNNSK